MTLTRVVVGAGDGGSAAAQQQVLRGMWALRTIEVPAAQNHKVLGADELPTNLTAAVNSASEGTVVTPHGGTFGTHSLAATSGDTALSPSNLLQVVESTTRSPLLSGRRRVFALLQGESGVVDGALISAVTPTRVQISFVRVTLAGDTLEPVPSEDTEGFVVDVGFVERGLLVEQTYLDGAETGIPPAVPSDITSSTGYLFTALGEIIVGGIA